MSNGVVDYSARCAVNTPIALLLTLALTIFKESARLLKGASRARHLWIKETMNRIKRDEI